MKDKGKGPGHSSSSRPRSPSADCRVWSRHELGRMLPEHHSDPPGLFSAFPDVELAQVTSLQMLLLLQGSPAEAHNSGIESSPHFQPGPWGRRADGLPVCLVPA